MLCAVQELTHFCDKPLLYSDAIENGSILAHYDHVVNGFEQIGKKSVNRGLVYLQLELLPHHDRELKHERHHLGQL